MVEEEKTETPILDAYLKYSGVKKLAITPFISLWGGFVVSSIFDGRSKVQISSYVMLFGLAILYSVCVYMIFSAWKNRASTGISVPFLLVLLLLVNLLLFGYGAFDGYHYF